MATSRLILFILPVLLSAQSDFSKFRQEQEKSFEKEKIRFTDFQKAEDEAFENHLKREKEEIVAFKKKLKAIWPDAELSSAKKLVNYSKDLKTKSLIDFKNNEIIISQISANEKEAKQKLFSALNETLNIDTQEVFAQSDLEQNIDKISNDSQYIKKAELNKVSLLKQEDNSSFEIDAKNIEITQKENVYQIKYILPADSTYQRSSKYLVLAKSNASRFNLQAQWLLAIMHTESSFNPMAKSYIPAFGLMQIVPKSAGIDSYRFLYEERRLLSASYLYNTENNIEIGSAYFHILYYKYLASIKDPQSRLYCAIAGYNTGAGNVARAFIGDNDVKKASLLINQMRPEDVYDYLLDNLKYDEPKQYLKQVRARSMHYKELYRL